MCTAVVVVEVITIIILLKVAVCRAVVVHLFPDVVGRMIVGEYFVSLSKKKSCGSTTTLGGDRPQVTASQNNRGPTIATVVVVAEE